MTPNPKTTQKTESPAALANVPEDESQDLIGLDMAFICAKATLDKKAEKVKVLDLRNFSSMADYFVVCSAMSDKQVQAICNHVVVEMKSQGFKVLSVEGLQEGRWVLIDFGDVIVHVFLDAIRDYYDIEGLWKHVGRVTLPSEFFAPAATPIPANTKLN